MNKKELVEQISIGADITQKQAETALNAFIASVTSALSSGDTVQLVGFGAFGVKERAARTGRNPRTGESIDIPNCKVIHFKAGKALKKAIN